MKILAVAIVVAGALIASAILFSNGDLDLLSEEDYETAVLDRLVDPDSARFRNVRDLRSQSAVFGVCGEVLSKNRSGGYGGWTRFHASQIEGSEEWKVRFDDKDFNAKMIGVYCD